MQTPIRSKTFLKLSVVLFLILLALSTYFAQQPGPSVTPSPDASPSASPTPTLPRTPSPTPLPGAQNFHQWGSVTVFNGLPSDSVRAIAQTPDGVMWFGTDNGLARFDGRRIQNFSLGGGHSASVLAIKTSAAGELWIGTQNGAFVYVDRGFRLVENTSGRGITSILIDENVLLGTDDGFVMDVIRSEGRTPTARSIISEPIVGADGGSLGITSLVKARGNLVAATAGRGALVIKNEAASELQTSPRPLFVNTLADNGSLWIGADAAKELSGVYLNSDGQRAVRVIAPTAKVLTLEADGSDLWAGTERYGLFHFSDSKLKKSYTFANTSGGLRSDTIYTLFTDREGVLWIGTNRGVSRFDRMGLSQETVSDIANSNFIRTLFFNHTKGGRSEYRTLLAGSNRGLFDFNGEKWAELPVFRGRPIYAIDTSPGKQDSTIVGTPDGVFDASGRVILEGDARAINYFAGRMYVAVFGRGVFDISGRSPRLVFSNGTVTALGGYREKMWIGTNGNGLFSFDGGRAKLELGPEELKIGSVWMVGGSSDKALEEGKEEVMLGGQHGVFIVRDGVPEQLLVAEDVRDVLGTRDDFLAATTSRGLIHAKRDSRFGWLVNYLGFEQGLPSEKAFAILATDDGILIATNRGIVRYKSSPIPPKLIATRVLSQRVHDLAEIGGKLDLEYPQNALLVEVAGQSSRTFPEEFQYVFVLVNSEGEEIARQLSNDSQYAPSDLAPGEYTIEAIAFNRDLLASEPLTIRFSVAKAPFPWTATALGVLLVIALLGLVWAFVANRRVLVRNRELAAAKLDLANEAERERRRIARDLHDQTLADLRSLMLLSDARKPEIEGFRDEIEAISGEVRRICEDLSPSVLENVGLVAALEFLLKSAIEKHSFVAKENLEEGIGFPMNIQLQIYRIAQEVLTNIKSHSTADTVEMIVDEHDGEFVMEIRDNGDAFDPESVTSRGRGIANIKARASMIGADIDWEQAEGNRFVLGISK